jgi:hypothetical protein
MGQKAILINPAKKNSLTQTKYNFSKPPIKTWAFHKNAKVPK